MRFGLTIAVSAALAGCATGAKFEANMNSMLHEDIGRAIGYLGGPVNMVQIDADRKVYTFQRNGQIVMPGQTYNTPVTTNTTGYVNNRPFNAQSTTYVPQQGAPTVIGLSCQVTVTTKYDLIVQWQSYGNHCVSR